MKISCLVVDDVALNRQTLLDLIAEVDSLESVGQCSNAEEAMNSLNELEPDVMFLDIEMPGMTGLDFLKSLSDPPLTVITTSHKEFAIESYEMNVFDYLVKPITRDRFQKCASRLHQYFKEKKKPPLPDQFFIRASNKYIRIRYEEIKYIEAMRDFVVVYLDAAKHVTMQTMKGFAAKLPEDKFIRVHRSYIVPISRIESIEGNIIRIADQKIPISEGYRDQVMKTLFGKDA
ncbi:MAG: LytR/AlgR family response regulator transcription factor [Chitinophagales bacterium]